MTGRRARLWELARLFTRLGFTAFGGPAAHVAMMHDEVVTRRAWLEDREFLDLLGATNLIPGPNSTELAIHVGRRRGGWPGLLVAGACFITPAMLIVLAIAWAYVRFGGTPPGEAILYGVAPVVIAIVAQALWKLGRVAVTDVLLGGVAAAVFGLYLLGANELLLLFGGGVLVMLARNARRLLDRASVVVPWFAAGGVTLLAVRATDAVPATLMRVFLTFLKSQLRHLSHL